MKTIVFPVEFTDNKGGVPQSVISLIIKLSGSEKLKLVVLCPKDSEISKYRFPSDVIVITSKARNWRISKKHFIFTLKVAWELFFKLKHYVCGDLLFVTNHSGGSFIVSLFPMLKKKEIYINRGGNLKSKGFGDSLMRYKIKHGMITHAVAISSRQKEILVEAGMESNKVSIIHNGLPLPKVDYIYRPLDEQSLWISTLGYISKTKNQHIGIELIKKLRDQGVCARLNIYGASCNDLNYEKMLSAKIKEFNVAEYVYYRGFVKGEELFNKTDILISFSDTEGFGRSLVEAMLRKIPVIAFRGAGGPVDITNDGVYGHLVDRNEPDCYYTLIMSMLAHPIENENNVLDSYKFACQMFTDTVMADEYRKLFEDLS